MGHCRRAAQSATPLFFRRVPVSGFHWFPLVGRCVPARSGPFRDGVDALRDGSFVRHLLVRVRHARRVGIYVPSPTSSAWIAATAQKLWSPGSSGSWSSPMLGAASAGPKWPVGLIESCCEEGWSYALSLLQAPRQPRRRQSYDGRRHVDPQAPPVSRLLPSFHDGGDVLADGGQAVRRDRALQSYQGHQWRPQGMPGQAEFQASTTTLAAPAFAASYPDMSRRDQAGFQSRL